MSNLTFVLDRPAVGAWLRSVEMEPLLRFGAQQVKDRCGEGYAVQVMPTRAIALVETATPEAYADNLQNNTLLKAASGGRTGKEVSGYWRTGKNGKKVYVQSYRRSK